LAKSGVNDFDPSEADGVLAITGFGFGSSSMAYLLGAQDAVDYHQRGIVTSTVSFCRTIGGSMGVGLLGAGFNVLSHDRLNDLTRGGVSPAAALDPHTQAGLPPETLDLIRNTIAGGLRWVFVAMLVVAVGQLIATLMMRQRLPVAAVRVADAVEA